MLDSSVLKDEIYNDLRSWINNGVTQALKELHPCTTKVGQRKIDKFAAALVSSDATTSFCENLAIDITNHILSLQIKSTGQIQTQGSPTTQLASVSIETQQALQGISPVPNKIELFLS